MDEFDKSLLGIHKERIEEIIYRPKVDYDVHTIAEGVFFILELLADQSEPKTEEERLREQVRAFIGIVESTQTEPNTDQHVQRIEYVGSVETPDLHDLMHRFEELCHDMTLQLRSASAEIALAIRETQGKE